MTDILIENVRLVQGHPMRRKPIFDKKTKLPVTDPVTGLQKTSMFMAVAVPKGAETDWKQTSWGQAIYNAGVTGWPNGEHASPAFAWKVVDGDSGVPDQKGIKPNTREGYPGNWIIKLSHGWEVICNHIDKLSAMEQIQDENEIKCGDYGHVFFEAVGNSPSESPGVYLNPRRYAQVRAGEMIQTGRSAADVFGGSGVQHIQPQTTPAPGVQPQTTPAPGVQPQTTPAPGVQPHVGFLNPTAAAAATPQSYRVIATGAVYTKDVLLGSGWTEEQIATQTTPV